MADGKILKKLERDMHIYTKETGIFYDISPITRNVFHLTTGPCTAPMALACPLPWAFLKFLVIEQAF